MKDYDKRSAFGCMPRFCAAFCGISVRILLLAIVAVNLAIVSALLQRITSFNGIALQNASPPAALIFSVIVSGVSIVWILTSFCFVAVPIFLLVGDTVFFVAWFAATIIVGVSLNRTLQYSCQELAVLLTGYGGLGVGYGVQLSGLNGAFPANSIAQQVYDSCNFSKVLFSFHILATVLFISVSMTAAIQASFGSSHRRRERVVEQNNTNIYTPAAKVGHNRGMTEIVV